MTDLTTTVVAQIGNSDDGLTQQKWAEFTHMFHNTMGVHTTLHFFGYSNPAAGWQNACAVGVVPVKNVENLMVRLAGLAKRFDQESVALTIGETLFVGPDYAIQAVGS